VFCELAGELVTGGVSAVVVASATARVMGPALGESDSGVWFRDWYGAQWAGKRWRFLESATKLSSDFHGVLESILCLEFVNGRKSLIRLQRSLVFEAFGSSILGGFGFWQNAAERERWRMKLRKCRTRGR